MNPRYVLIVFVRTRPAARVRFLLLKLNLNPKWAVVIFLENFGPQMNKDLKTHLRNFLLVTFSTHENHS